MIIPIKIGVHDIKLDIKGNTYLIPRIIVH